MVTFNAYFLAAYFLFVAVFYTVRLQMRPTPRQYIGERGSSHWLGHVAFRFFRVLILSVCVARVFYPSIDTYLLVCPALMVGPVLLSGVAMLVCGFLFTVIGHYTLGASWLSGINPEQRVTLVTTGVYGRSRNPMFIGVLATQIGFFLALPSVFTFVCLVVGFCAVFNQVRLEEAHLAQAVGDEYTAYTERVPRWV
jgi:protein-S-isoprenylcysteine O-methyltransferase Ste14